MEKISVLGLGRMGGALAGALLGAGHEVTVWNRSPLKAGPLLDRGARLAATPAEAVAASDIAVTCLSTYDTQQSVLDIAGKPAVLISLTSGTPEQARVAAKWASGQGITYVDGVLMAVPQTIGTPAARVLHSGAAGHSELLEVFGAATYLGADAGLAALYDLALLGIMWSAMSGFLHGVALVGTEGVPPSKFAPMATEWLSAVTASFPRLAEQAGSGAYETDVSSLDINAEGLKLLVETSRAQGIGTAVPAPLRDLFERAVADGHGAHSIASVVEVIGKR